MKQIKKEVIQNIVEEIGIPEFEYNIYEASTNDLQNFADRIIELYESDDFEDATY